MTLYRIDFTDDDHKVSLMFHARDIKTIGDRNYIIYRARKILLVKGYRIHKKPFKVWIVGEEV